MVYPSAGLFTVSDSLSLKMHCVKCCSKQLGKMELINQNYNMSSLEYTSNPFNICVLTFKAPHNRVSSVPAQRRQTFGEKHIFPFKHIILKTW